MKTREIARLIATNDSEDIKSIYEKAYEKLAELNKRVDTATRNLVVVGVLWLVSTKASVESFSIGPVTLKDTTLFEALLPIIFCYFLFDIVAVSKHKGEVFQVAKTIASHLYEGDDPTGEYEQTKHSSFIRVLMPFSYSLDSSRVSTADKQPILLTLFGFLLLLPLPIVLLGLFFLPFYMVRYLFQHQTRDTLIHASAWVSLWMLLIIVFYVLTGMATSMRQIRNGEQNIA